MDARLRWAGVHNNEKKIKQTNEHNKSESPHAEGSSGVSYRLCLDSTYSILLWIVVGRVQQIHSKIESNK